MTAYSASTDLYAAPPRRVLFSLFQTPYDPASGAALATLSIMRILAAQPARFTVRCLCTTSSEAVNPALPLVLLAQHAIRAEIDRKGAVGKGKPVLKWAEQGVTFSALDTSPHHALRWGRDAHLSAQFNRLLLNELQLFKPDVVAMYGGSGHDQLRRQACWESGAAVVQLVHNMEYLHKDAFQHTDAVWVPSAFSARRYREVAGVNAVAIAPPCDRADVLCESRVPERFLFVNPNSHKGAFLIIRLIDELRRRRPDIPLQIIEGRASAKDLFAEARTHGLDLSLHPSLLITPTVPRSSMVFARAKCLIMPSVWYEPFGKLTAEAMVNGVPALVSSRGGLSEAAGLDPNAPPMQSLDGVPPAAAFVLPIPESLTDKTYVPVSPEAALPWLRAMERLHDDAAFYAACCACTPAAAAQVREETLHPRYVELFAGVRRAWRSW